MPVLVTSPAFLSGFAVGFFVGAGIVSAACAVVGYHRRQVRRLVLGFSARALVDALNDLEQDGELGYHHMHRVGERRDLAAAVARVAEE